MAPEPNGPTRVVAFGPMRSGNVLLEQLVAAHPEVRAIRPLDPLLQLACDLGLRWDTPLAPSVASRLLAHGSRFAQGVSKGHEPLRDLNALHRRLSICAADDAPIIYLRMHQPLALLADLARTADVRCVCVIRDVRDVVLSRFHRGDRRVAQYVRGWRRFADVASALEARGHARVVRFEDLVESPEHVEASLGEWLGLPLDLRGGEAVRWPSHSSFGPLPGRVSRAPVGRWRERRADPAVRYAGFVGRRELARWGYPPPDRVAPGQAIRFLAQGIGSRAYLSSRGLLRMGRRRVAFRVGKRV